MVAIALQAGLPDQLSPGPPWLLPALEAVLLIVLLVANPFRMGGESALLRVLGLGLAGLVGLATAPRSG